MTGRRAWILARRDAGLKRPPDGEAKVDPASTWRCHSVLHLPLAATGGPCSTCWTTATWRTRALT